MILSEDVDLKQEGVMMSPPASDSGSSSPHQFSPYCVDSEPGSPLLDHHQVKHVRAGLMKYLDVIRTGFIQSFIGVFLLCLQGEERAGLSLHGGSDGPFSAAAVRADLLLPVSKPTPLFAGLRGAG